MHTMSDVRFATSGNDDYREALTPNESDGYGTDEVVQTLGGLTHYNYD
jgi:hypothetical protein